MKTYSAILAGILTAPLSMLGDPLTADQDLTQSTQSTYQSQQEQSDSKRTANANTKVETKMLNEQVVTASGYSQNIKEAPASISIIGREEILTRPIRDIGDAKVETKMLNEQVVTASGYSQNIKEAPASISIIGREEILTRPIRDIGDAVQDVPGVYVEQDKTGQNSISMRGLSSSYTLILIDGKRQNTTRGFVQNGLGNQTSFMPPASMIEKIEVIRGPASIIYGSDAMGGVINIITKKHTDKLASGTSFMPPASMIEKIEVIRGPASIIYGSDAMGGVINIITKKHTDKLASGIQLESKFFEPDSEWGNAYGANAYINTPLIKDKLSLNLRGSGRFNDANKFLKPSWVSPSSNGNPYAAHSSTGSRNFSGGFRLNYTPTSRDYIYLDSEIYNGRLGSLNTSGRSITSIQELFKVNSVLSHEGKYEWGKLSSYV